MWEEACLLRSPLAKHFSDQGGKEKKKKSTNQLKDCTKSGLSLLRDRCRITSMRNLTMTLPPPPPPPPKQSLPLLPNYYRTLKPTSVTLKLKGREVEEGVGFVLIRSCTQDFGLFLKAKKSKNQFSSFSFFFSLSTRENECGLGAADMKGWRWCVLCRLVDGRSRGGMRRGWGWAEGICQTNEKMKI